MAHHGKVKIGRTDLERRADLPVKTWMLLAQEFDFEAIVTFCSGLLEGPGEDELSVVPPWRQPS
jgi:hypothetical protein